MTAALADFIASPEGEMYGAYCRAYGEHPGDVFGDDDALRFQVGMAYVLRDSFIKPTETGSAVEYEDGRRVVRNPNLT